MVSHVDFLTACGKGDLQTIRKYIEMGGDVNAISNSGNTGLRNACVGDNAEVVQLLLEYGADANQELWIKSRVRDVFLCEKGVVIFYARSKNIVETLKSYGADLASTDGHGTGVEEWWRHLGRDEKFIALYF